MSLSTAAMRPSPPLASTAFVFSLKVGSGPRVGAIGAGLTHGRFVVRALDLDGSFARQRYFETLVQQNQVFGKCVVKPELTRSQRFRDPFTHSELQYIADSQAFYGNVFFTKVAIERGFARNFRGHILNVFRRGLHHGSVGLPNPD